MEINTKHFELDKYNLEAAACTQSSLYQFYGQLVADKQKELDKANLRYDQAEAALKIKLKEANPKMTVDMLSAACLGNEDISKMAENIINLKHELATLKTAVSAMEQKRAMIEVEAKLQNNALYQQRDVVGDHSSAEWAEKVLSKQMQVKSEGI